MLQDGEQISASLEIDQKEIDLKTNGSLEIANSQSQVYLHLGSGSLRDLPKEYVLNQNYPNPFNPTTTLSYALPTDSKVTLKVYNVLGQVVANLVNGVVSAGYRSAMWNASNVATGLYFYRIEATSVSNTSKTFVQVRKMILMK